MIKANAIAGFNWCES